MSVGVGVSVATGGSVGVGVATTRAVGDVLGWPRLWSRPGRQRLDWPPPVSVVRRSGRVPRSRRGQEVVRRTTPELCALPRPQPGLEPLDCGIAQSDTADCAVAGNESPVPQRRAHPWVRRRPRIADQQSGNLRLSAMSDRPDSDLAAYLARKGPRERMSISEWN